MKIPILARFLVTLWFVINVVGESVHAATINSCEEALMNAKLRIARATNDLNATAQMYQQGLGLSVLCSFRDHAGFDGIVLGHTSAQYHFEFTQEKGAEAPRSPSSETLVVFYLPEPGEWERTKTQMLKADFKEVPSHNPYWDQNGVTFEDHEGYRVVLCNRIWK